MKRLNGTSEEPGGGGNLDMGGVGLGPGGGEGELGGGAPPEGMGGDEMGGELGV